MMPDPADQELFQRWWTATMPSLSAYVHGLVPRPDEAEDVLQDVAVVALRRFAEYDRDRSFRAWVFGIARHTVLAKRRSFARNRILAHSELVAALTDTAERHADDLLEHRHALRACLQRFDGRSREALRLRYGEHLPFAAVAERLRTSAVAARKLLSRLRARLRACIEARLQEASP